MNDTHPMEYISDFISSYSYFGARYYDPNISIWLSVDPLSDKDLSVSGYAYVANNPLTRIDPNGMIWRDIDGNAISKENQKDVKVYIFYDPSQKGFKRQSMRMAKAAEKEYGKGSVALSDVTTTKEFKQDWSDMGGRDVKEVNLNYHGDNQTLMLDSKNAQYITSTGDGFTHKSGAPALNVGELSNPQGNIADAQLNINSCSSNSLSQYSRKGPFTLAGAFRAYTDFNVVRGTSAGVSYNRITMMPEPQYPWQSWDYLFKNRAEFRNAR
jgi:RHS repeat-associated protein